MKRLLQITALAILVILGSSWRNSALAQVEADISYQTFYDELSPYGEWVEYPDYGYVWVPSEGPDFQPYRSSGHWVWSEEYDWIWVSDYSWGWAPFHYGRWFYDPFYGWMWVPGYEWAPAWVAWRDGGDYYGWAPLWPGISINIGIGTYNPPIDYWCFAPRRYISSPYIYNYCVDRSRNVTIINNTTIINNYNRRNNVFVTGPRRVDAERYAGRINPVRLRDASRPGRTQFRRNELSVYRPRVQNDNRQNTPRSFERYDRNRGQNNSNAIGRNRGNSPNPRNGNNLPSRRDTPIDRGNNNEAGQRSDNNNNRGGFGRRIERRNDQQPNNDSRNGNIERRRDIPDRGNEQPNTDRRPGRNFGRPDQPQANPPQQRSEGNTQRRNIFERRNNSSPGQMERRQQQPRQMERPQRQMERPQQQPRQFESRRSGNENREQHNSGSNNGRGRRR